MRAQVERKDLAWERWYDLSSQEIGELIKAPKIGKQLHRMIHEFPRLELAAQVCADMTVPERKVAHANAQVEAQIVWTTQYSFLPCAC